MKGYQGLPLTFEHLYDKLRGGLEGLGPPTGSRGRAPAGVWGRSPWGFFSVGRLLARGALGIAAEIPQVADNLESFILWDNLIA